MFKLSSSVVVASINYSNKPYVFKRPSRLYNGIQGHYPIAQNNVF